MKEIPIIEAAIEREHRILIYKLDKDAPYRIEIMPHPLTPDSNVIIASGNTLEDAIADLSTATLEMLDQLSEPSIVKQEITILPSAPPRKIT